MGESGLSCWDVEERPSDIEERVFTGVTGGVAELYGMRVVMKLDMGEELSVPTVGPH